MRVLVTGGDGALATALRAFLPDAIYLSHTQLDVTNEDAVGWRIRTLAPNVVLHTAAVTDHQCRDVAGVVRTNVTGTLLVARAASDCKAKLVYLSTHYVYPGTRGHYTEADAVNPIGLYAATKYAGEGIVRAMCVGPLIIRGSWYTPEKLALWREKGALVDAWCARESVASAAEKVARLVTSPLTGVVNIAGPRRTFADIATENYDGPVPLITRDSLALAYPFPVDSSVVGQ